MPLAEMRGAFCFLFFGDMLMFRLILLTFLVFSLSIPLSYASEAGVADFNSGVQSFKQKKYQSALKYFIQASKAGMKKSSLNYNIGVSYYKLKKYKKSEVYFKLLANDKSFRQIAYYNLGLIAEKRNQKNTAIKRYTEATKYSENKKITLLANKQLDRLLNRSNYRSQTEASISFALGSDDNITNATINSPSNKSDSYQEIYANFTTPLNRNTNFKGSLLWLNYNTVSTENFMFYTAALDYTVNTKSWKIIPEISLLQSTLNSSAYQNIFNFKTTGKHNLDNNTALWLSYRYSNIQSQNTAYNYLQGSRHQLRVDYKKRINKARLRFRYQLESNQRQNSATANYSPTRHTFRIRYQHKLANNWKLYEEAGYRISQYGAAAGLTRNDQRLRLRLAASKKLSKEWQGGIRYSYTKNSSNLASVAYNRNNIQIFSNWDF